MARNSTSTIFNHNWQRLRGKLKAMTGRRLLWLSILCISSIVLSSCVKRPDALPPLIKIISPKNGAVQSADMKIIGYALDDEGIAAIRVGGDNLLESELLQGERTKKLIQFAFRPTSQQSGKWQTTIQVEDINGRLSTLEYGFEIDAFSPSVKVKPPRDVGGGRMEVSGVARDNLLLERIVVNGIEVSFSPVSEKFFNVSVEAAPSVTTVVYDQAGNSATWQNTLNQ